MIRLSMMRTFICLILAGAGLAACSGWFQNGQPYALPRAEVHRILAQTGIPPLIFGTIPPKYKIERSDPSNIVWIIKKQDHEALRFVANLTSTSSTSTRVSIELKGPSEGPYRETSRKLVENRSIANLYIIAMEEQVAAALENRPFQMSKLYPQLAPTAVANYGQLMASVDRSKAAAATRQGRACDQSCFVVTPQ